MRFKFVLDLVDVDPEAQFAAYGGVGYLSQGNRILLAQRFHGVAAAADETDAARLCHGRRQFPACAAAHWCEYDARDERMDRFGEARAEAMMRRAGRGGGGGGRGGGARLQCEGPRR